MRRSLAKEISMTESEMHARIRRWLAARDPGEVPASMRDAVAEVAYDQPRSWRSGIAAAVAIAAAAVVVVTLLGYQILVAPNVGGPGPLIPTATPTPVPTPTVVPLPRGTGGQVDAGTYRLGPGTGVDSAGNAILPPMTLTIGEGWRLWHDSHSPPGLDKDGEGGLGIYALTEFDTGDYGLTEEESACGAYYSPDPALFVDATLENVVAYVWSDSTGTIADTVVDGRPAKTLIEESEFSDRIHCPGDPLGPPWDPATTGRITNTTTVVEVDGSVVFIGTERWASADSIQAEFDEIIASIRFE
jgi:hypothetical protein